MCRKCQRTLCVETHACQHVLYTLHILRKAVSILLLSPCDRSNPCKPLIAGLNGLSLLSRTEPVSLPSFFTLLAVGGRLVWLGLGWVVMEQTTDTTTPAADYPLPVTRMFPPRICSGIPNEFLLSSHFYQAANPMCSYSNSAPVRVPDGKGAGFFLAV
jgi:hypothetical protein